MQCSNQSNKTLHSLVYTVTNVGGGFQENKKRKKPRFFFSLLLSKVSLIESEEIKMPKASCCGYSLLAMVTFSHV
jgi:hypothetical protein